MDASVTLFLVSGAPKRRRVARACLLVVCCWLAALDLQAQPIAVESPIIQEFVVQPGEAYKGQVVLINPSDDTRYARVYQTDYFKPNATGYAFDEPGSHRRSNAGWIKMPASVIKVPPRSKVPVDYQIRVPAATALTEASGTFWSAIMVEGMNPNARAQPAKGISISETFRYCTLIATQLGQSGRPEVQFTEISMNQKAVDDWALLVDFQNVGDRSIRPQAVWAEIYDTQGRKQQHATKKQLSIFLPGNHYREILDLGRLAPGKYKALVLIDGGDNVLFGAQMELTIPFS